MLIRKMLLVILSMIFAVGCQNPFGEDDKKDSDPTVPPVNYALYVFWESASSNDDVLNATSITESSSGPPVQIGSQGALLSARDEPTDAVIVRYKSGIVSSQALNSLDSSVVSSSTIQTGADGELVRYVVDSTKSSVDSFVSQMESDSSVLYAEPDHRRYALGVPNDPGYLLVQWNLQQLSMDTVWDTVTGSDNVVVAVIDTGVAYDLSDFATTSFVPGWDFVNDDANPYDDNSHGTHVAGTIAQSTNNGFGVAGMAPGVSIMPLKSLGQDGSGYVSDTAEAIVWAVDHGADVINLSLGSASASTTEEDAVRYAYENGVAVIAATGNDNGPVGYPAAYDSYVLAVGATGHDDSRASYSNFGPQVDVVAPGGDGIEDGLSEELAGITQQTFLGYDPVNEITVYDVGFFLLQGTSMATPHVAGLAALILSKNPYHDAPEIYSMITSNAEDLGTAGRDDDFGYGLIDPVATLGASQWGLYDSHGGSLSDSGPATATYELTLDDSEFGIQLSQQMTGRPIHLFLYDKSGVLVDSVEDDASTKIIEYTGGTGNAPFTVELRLAN